MAKAGSGDLINTASGGKWKRLGTQRRAGILIPLFSVYSKNSLGIGDFSDLKLLIDLCQKSGNSVLQLLPMNEVGSTFCPYDAVSSYALEPVYLSLSALRAPKGKTVRDEIKKAAGKFPPGRPNVDYRVKWEKLRLLWEMFSEEGLPDSKELKKFRADNSYWLDDFALFKVLKYHSGGKPWYEWDEKYRYRDDAALENFKNDHRKEAEFQIWIQWLAFRQFKEAKSYAASKEILLKGDLPILISRDSADVWVHPEFFKLSYTAGAPPDMYCAKGQRWGMPTYDWDRIAGDDFRYVKEKLKTAENFYDMLRVDHVVGLFRIWSIPYGDPAENMGLNGSFDPRDEKLWEERGRRLLSVMLDSTKMLLSAEDLGMIPRVCPETLKRLGIPGNDVQRWMKDWEKKHDFLEPGEYRFISVNMLSTHDTTNWAAWWENEAGTVDEALFVRKCNERGIDYSSVKEKLFNSKMSRHGRLRWSDSIKSSEVLVDILGKRREELADFIDLYENSCREKEKLWKHLGLKGAMRERSDPQIIKAALEIALGARSIFSIQLMTDWLMMAGIFKGDPYQYRVNTPGTVSEKNWSLTLPISLGELSNNKITDEMKKMIDSCERR